MSNRIDLAAEDFDRYVKLAEEQGITPAEYLKRALEAYAKYHHPKVEGRLHTCVNAVACSVCQAVKGEPCKHEDSRRHDRLVKYSLDTHARRRDAYKKMRDAERHERNRESANQLAEIRHSKDEERAKKRAEAAAKRDEKERIRKEKHAKKLAEVTVKYSGSYMSTDGHPHNQPSPQQRVMFCEHANECPYMCPCPPGCICKDGWCGREKSASC